MYNDVKKCRLDRRIVFALSFCCGLVLTACQLSKKDNHEHSLKEKVILILDPMYVKAGPREIRLRFIFKNVSTENVIVTAVRQPTVSYNFGQGNGTLISLYGRYTTGSKDDPVILDASGLNMVLSAEKVLHPSEEWEQLVDVRFSHLRGECEVYGVQHSFRSNSIIVTP